MLKRFLHFLQYNNALPIAFSALFLSVSGAFAASPDVRDAVYSTQSSVRSVDNTYLSSVDPNNRDFKLRITGITEDSDKYYVDYSFNTVDVKNYVWQEVPVAKTMTVSKKELLGGDLGIFVARELSQLIDSQKAYLAEAKKIALKEGITQKVVTVEYSGLVGKFLNPTEETFAGYTPTKPDTDTLASPPAPTTTPPVLSTEVAVVTGPETQSVSTPSQPPAPDASAIRAMIEQAVREALANSASSNTASVSSGGGSSSSNTSSGSSSQTTSSTDSSSSSTSASSDSASSTTATTDTSTTTTTETPVVPDTTAPTITLNGNNPAEVEVGSSYIDLGAVVTDNVDQNLGFTMTPNSVDTSTTSTQTLTFTATDSAGNTTSVTRTVNVH